MTKPGLLVIGDSQIKYSDKLAELLGSFNVTTISVPGLKLEGIAGELVEVTEYFDHIIVHVGTNNLSGDSVEEIMMKVNVVMEDVRKRTDCHLYFSGIVPQTENRFVAINKQTRTRTMVLNKKAKEVNEKLEHVCNESKGFFYIDSPNKFFDNNGRLLKYLLATDGFHLSRQGVKVLSKVFATNVNNVFHRFTNILSSHSVADLHPDHIPASHQLLTSKTPIENFCFPAPSISDFPLAHPKRKEIHGGGNPKASLYPRICDKCCKEYTSKASYSNHLRLGRCKPVETEQEHEAEEVSDANKTDPKSRSNHCFFCKEQFATLPQLLKHMDSHHEGVPSSGSEEMPSEDDDLTSEESSSIICPDCSVAYQSGFAYRRHLVQCSHEKVQFVECIDPNCNQKFHKYYQLINHLENHHNLDLGIQNLHFTSTEEFELWKKQEEESSYVKFIKNRGNNTTQTGTMQYYVCKYDVQHRRDRTPKTPRKKFNGEKICNTECPARLYVFYSNNGINIKYISRHNHELKFRDVKHFRWPAETKNYINLQLEREVPSLKIKEDFTPEDIDLISEHPMKEHFISTAQINKMRYSFKMKQKLHKNDAVSVELLVDVEKDSIFLYKPQGGPIKVGNNPQIKLPDSDSLVIGIQSERQRVEMIEGSKKILIIDTTHSTNLYDFYVTNLIVPDEYGIGYPVAHFITSSIDTTTMTACFRALKLKNPDVDVNVYITDDDQALYNSFKSVFGSKPTHLLCKWHVKRAWKKNLHIHVKDKELRKEISRCLFMIIEEPSIETFNEMCQNFRNKYIKICPEFCDYFSDYYVNRASLWAMCHRNFPHFGTDTTMYVESFHNKLKTGYLKRKFNRRVDDLIYVLLKVDKHLHLAVVYKRMTGELPCGKRKQKNSRHMNGMLIPDEDVEQISPTEFYVKSQSKDDTHCVKFLSTKCTHPDICFIMCGKSPCGDLCCHMYSCSCDDINALCKHIHKVHSMNVPDDTPDNDILLDCLLDDNDDDDDNDADSGFDDTFAGVSLYDPPPQEELLSSEQKCENMVASCTEQMTLLQSMLSTTKLQPLLSHIHETLKLLVSKSKGLISSDKPFAPPPTMKRNRPAVAPNQNLDTQAVSFWRTTKKKGESKRSYRLFSSDAERSLVRSSLINQPENCHQSSGEDLENISNTNQNFTGTISESTLATKPLFQEGPFEIQLYHIKSLDYNISPEDLSKIKSEVPNFTKGWLYDCIIYTYLVRISENHPLPVKIIDPAESQKIHCLDRDPLRGVDVMRYKKLFIPCNPTNTHWVLLVVYPEEKVVWFYDPACESDTIRRQYRSFLSLWGKHLAAKTGTAFTDWMVNLSKHTCQIDSYNCGVFVSWYCDQIINGLPIDIPLDTEAYRFHMFSTLMGRPLRKPTC